MINSKPFVRSLCHVLCIMYDLDSKFCPSVLVPKDSESNILFDAESV